MRGSTVPLSRVSGNRNSRKTFVRGLPSETVALEDAQQYAYLINVEIGGQAFEVILDTASSDLWVVSTDCSSEDCQGVPKYNNTSTLSVSSVLFNLSYLTGSVSGTVGFEEVFLDQFEISSQAFAFANNTTSLGLSLIQASGVLGLAFPSEATVPETTGRTLLENLFAALDGPDRFFGFRLDRTGLNSTFSLGRLDSNFIQNSSDLLYTPVYSPDGQTYDYWKLPMLSLSIDSTPFNLSATKVPRASSPVAVLDTGTTLILGPTRDVDAFWTAVGGSRKANDGSWQVKCDHSVLVGIVLGNDTVHREYILDPADINWESGDEQDGWCMGGIQGNDGVVSGDWLLGDVFLRNVYVTHHAWNATSAPLIGLLNLTDPSTALKSFQMIRGQDSISMPPSPPAQIDASTTRNAFSTRGAVIIGMSALLSFLTSAALVVLMRVVIRKRRKITKEAGKLPIFTQYTYDLKNF